MLRALVVKDLTKKLPFLLIVNCELYSEYILCCRRQERERKRNKRMTFVLSCIAITFAVSFLPLHLFFTVTDLGLWGITAQNIKVLTSLLDLFLHQDHQNHHLDHDLQMYYFILGLCHCVAFSSCVSNPVLYGWLNTNLRKEFLKVSIMMSVKLISTVIWRNI